MTVEGPKNKTPSLQRQEFCRPTALGSYKIPRPISTSRQARRDLGGGTTDRSRIMPLYFPCKMPAN